MMFTLTPEHILLLRQMCVNWQDCETGAPEIDPKRPYGNREVTTDIHAILTGESVGYAGSARDALTETEERTYLALHRTMDTALEVVLRTGAFVPGVYVSDPYRHNWRVQP
jgi:hypothetical protein